MAALYVWRYGSSKDGISFAANNLKGRIANLRIRKLLKYGHVASVTVTFTDGNSGVWTLENR